MDKISKFEHLEEKIICKRVYNIFFMNFFFQKINFLDLDEYLINVLSSYKKCIHCEPLCMVCIL